MHAGRPVARSFRYRTMRKKAKVPQACRRVSASSDNDLNGNGRRRPSSWQGPDLPCKKLRHPLQGGRSILAHLPLWACNLPPHARLRCRGFRSFRCQTRSGPGTMDVISSDRKTVGKVDHLDASDKIKLTKQSSPNGEHHHFIPVSWIHPPPHKTGADVTAHWEHEGRVLDYSRPPSSVRRTGFFFSNYRTARRASGGKNGGGRHD